MKYGIICAMDEEIKRLHEELEDEKKIVIGGGEFFEGTIGGKDVVLVRCGIGKVAAGSNTKLLFSKFDVDCIINTGSAAGIGNGLSVGDVVISTQTAYHDVDLTAAGFKIGQFPGLPVRFDADEKLQEQILLAAKKSKLTVRSGLIVSGDQFVSSKEKIANIKENFPDALGCEMEGAAIGQVAYEFKKPFVVVRAISDLGDESASQSFDEFILEAGKRSAQMVINLLG